jgi:hypothetical protein
LPWWKFHAPATDEHEAQKRNWADIITLFVLTLTLIAVIVYTVLTHRQAFSLSVRFKPMLVWLEPPSKLTKTPSTLLVPTLLKSKDHIFGSVNWKLQLLSPGKEYCGSSVTPILGNHQL